VVLKEFFLLHAVDSTPGFMSLMCVEAYRGNHNSAFCIFLSLSYR